MGCHLDSTWDTRWLLSAIVDGAKYTGDGSDTPRAIESQSFGYSSGIGTGVGSSFGIGGILAIWRHSPQWRQRVAASSGFGSGGTLFIAPGSHAFSHV